MAVLNLIAGLASILPLAASVGGMETGAAVGKYGGVLVWELWGDSGTLCFVSDGITTQQTAQVNRYQVNRYQNGLQPAFRDGVYIRAKGGGYQALEVVIQPGLEFQLFNIAQLDESGTWFANNSQIPPLGQACLDDGVEAAIKVIESTHNIQVQP